MRIDKKRKPWLISEKTADTRLHLEQTWLRGDRLIATNGKAAASIPVYPESTDTDGPIPAAVLQSCKPSGSFLIIEANGTLDYQTKAGPVSTPRPAFAPKPSLLVCCDETPHGQDVTDRGLVLPREDNPCLKPDTPITVKINPALLYHLAQAMGATEGVSLTIPADDRRAITVRPLNDNTDLAPVGIIMPITLTRG